jgi:DNA-binding winged helix-turn-helix (wHTH) protein
MSRLNPPTVMSSFDRERTSPAPQVYRFDDFVLAPALFELRCGNRPVPVAPKVFDLILFLVENHGRVLTHAELLATLWPGVTVTAASLTYSVMAARRALGDAGHTQRFIRNVRSRGYQFAAAVQEGKAQDALATA